MGVKIDTREKFHVITIKQPAFAANMTADLQNCLLSLPKSSVKNVVLNLGDVKTMDESAAETLVRIQQDFYDQNMSFVICCLQPELEEWLDRIGLLEIMNTTPTESEAWDVVQMEEIERDILDGDDKGGL